MMLVLLYNIIQLYKIQSSQKYCRGPFTQPSLSIYVTTGYVHYTSFNLTNAYRHSSTHMLYSSLPSTELQIYRFRLNVKTYITLSKNHTRYNKKCGISIKLECKKSRREVK